jgi:hypothetical protein
VDTQPLEESGFREEIRELDLASGPREVHFDNLLVAQL